MNHHPTSRLAALRWQFRTHGTYRRALWIIVLLLATALFADFLANDKPLACSYKGHTYFPVLQSYGKLLGKHQWPEEFHREDWHARSYSWVIFPPIPYHPGYLDLQNTQFKSPFEHQTIKNWRFRHWLGTDMLGRDVLAGLIHGTRSALVVGLLGTLLALLIGIVAGGMSGYYGDDKFRAGPLAVLTGSVGLVLGSFYAIQVVRLFSDVSNINAGMWLGILAGVLVFILLFRGFWLLGKIMDKRWTKFRIRIPVDLILMRIIEAVQAMPGMLLLLALIPLCLYPAGSNVVLIVGLVRWPTVARFVLGELLKIRVMPYIESAELAGIPQERILWRHALPNALQPLLILAAFSISSGVLLEAFLSFLGLGVPADQVTWGSLLNLARKQFDAWWLALFPGLAIFLTVTAFNLAGDGLQEWLDGKKPYLR